MANHRIPLPSMKTTLTIIVVVVYTITLTSLFVSVLDGTTIVRVPTVGNLVVLGYEAHGGDIIMQGNNATLDWGTIRVGTSANRSFYLQSQSTTTTIPQLNTTDWIFRNADNQPVTPPSVNGIELNWTLNNGTQLAQRQEVYVTLTLTINSDDAFVNYVLDNNVKTFSFDIIIQPSQV